jgi:hypothetical protein
MRGAKFEKVTLAPCLPITSNSGQTKRKLRQILSRGPCPAIYGYSVEMRRFAVAQQ